MSVVFLKSGPVSKDFYARSVAGLEVLPEGVRDILAQKGYGFFLTHREKDVWETYPETIKGIRKVASEGTLEEIMDVPFFGLCVYFTDPPFIVLREDGARNPAAVLVHEVGHAIDLSREVFLSDDPRFREAYEKDLKIANITRATVGHINKNAAADIGFFLDITVDKQGPKEVWADHFVEVVSGRPHKKYISANYPNTLEVVRMQLEELRLLPPNAPGSPPQAAPPPKPQ